MTKTAIEMEKIKTNERIADKDRKQRERASKRETYVGAVTKMLPSFKLPFPKGNRKNDVEWYTKYIQNEGVYSQIPTFTRLGDNLKETYPMNIVGISASDTRYAGLPAIATIALNSTVGRQRYKTLNDVMLNDINQILMRSKQSVLKLNSRSNVEWEGADLGLNLLATADIIAAMGELATVIMAANTFSPNNLYMPRQIIQAYGFNPDDVLNNLNAYEKIYETLRLEFNNSIVAPLDMSLYARKWMLATSVVKDSDTPLAQLYNFSWTVFFKLDQVGHTLTRVEPNFTSHTNTYTFIHGLIQSIVENPSFIEMYSDLRHAFGSRLWQIPEIVKGSKLTPYYNPEVLNQIKNINTPLMEFTAGGQPSQTSTLKGVVRSLSNGYLWDGTLTEQMAPSAPTYFVVGDANTNNLAITFSNLRNTGRRLINLEDNKDKYENILEATRFSAIFTAEKVGTEVRVTPESCGTEVVQGITILMNMYSSVTGQKELIPVPVGTEITGQADFVSDNFKYSVLFPLAISTQFDWFPIIHVGMPSVEVPGVMETATFGDVNAHYISANDNLDQSHTFCNLSLFYLPDSQFSKKGD